MLIFTDTLRTYLGVTASFCKFNFCVMFLVMVVYVFIKYLRIITAETVINRDLNDINLNEVHKLSEVVYS